MMPKHDRIAEDFTIRMPLKMLQLTDEDGKVWPVAFFWPDADGITSKVAVDNVRSIVTQAEQKSGTVGDRYECEIEGKIEYIYYTKLTPRKWFKIVPVSEREYNEYYRLPGEKSKSL
jgi:hypothetical protein